jgi:hypothetical protein
VHVAIEKSKAEEHLKKLEILNQKSEKIIE